MCFWMQLKKLEPWKLVALDTSCEDSIDAAAKALESVSIDLLVNNAGTLENHGLQDTTKTDLMRQFEVNAVSPFLVTRAFLSNLRLAMRAQGTALVAQIISGMSSISDNWSRGYFGYCASKNALNMITTSLTVDLEKEKIGYLLLHPDYVNTAMMGFNGTVSPEDSVAGLTKIILGATVRDSAKMCHFEKGEIIPF